MKESMDVCWRICSILFLLDDACHWILSDRIWQAEENVSLAKAGHSMIGLRTVSKKLKSNDGASLMLALLFFLICAVAGSVVLTSATASAGRAASLQDSDQQQEEYAVDSAAAMLKSELKQEGVYVKVETTSPKFSNIDEAPAEGWTTTIGLCNADGTDKSMTDEFFEKLINARINGSANYDDSNYLKKIELDTQNPVLVITLGSNSGIPTVKATPSITGDSQDTLSIRLQKEDTRDESNPYSVTITGKIQVGTVSESVHTISPTEAGEDKTGTSDTGTGQSETADTGNGNVGENDTEDEKDKLYQQVKTKIVKYSLTNLTYEDWGRQ